MRLIRWFKHKFFGCQWKPLPEYLRKEAGLPEGIYKYCTYCGKVELNWYLRCAHCKRWYKAVWFTVTFGRVYNEPESDRRIIMAEMRHTAERAVCPGFDPICENEDDYVSISHTELKTTHEKRQCEYFPKDRDITKCHPWGKARECR